MLKETRTFWIDVMNFIDKNNTWELCTLPRGIKAIGIK
jgi:hypothetical protein